MPKVTQEHSLARRQQIIDAAYRCFSRNGFHQTSMRDIYQEAGLSAGAVYHYFESKHEIIAGSFDFDYERSRGMFNAAAESEDPLGARWRTCSASCSTGSKMQQDSARVA